jgi:uncharacterized protein (TIGR02246 family)
VSSRDITSLYREILHSWNERDAIRYADGFTDDGTAIGFDGSRMSGRAEIAETLAQIFRDHPTAHYVASIREIRQLGSGAALLTGVAGMVPPGGSDVNPGVNAIQTLVAVHQDGAWRAVMFQNTPAAFHGRPEMSERLTEELRAALRDDGVW